jgi:hypothetical protein
MQLTEVPFREKTETQKVSRNLSLVSGNRRRLHSLPLKSTGNMDWYIFLGLELVICVSFGKNRNALALEMTDCVTGKWMRPA